MNHRILLLLALSGFSSMCSVADDAPKLFPITKFGAGWPQPGSLKGGFIDEKGTVVMPPTADIMPPHHGGNSAHFAEGLEPVEVQLKTKWPALAWGFMDIKFNFAIEPQFEGAEPFSEGLAPVRDKKDGPPWSLGYIDHTGKFVIVPQFEEAHEFSEGLAQVVNSDHVMGYIDHKGKWVIPPQYYVRSAQSDFSEGLACVGKRPAAENDPSKSKSPPPDFAWGYIDKTGAQVIDFKFKEAEGFHNGFAAVQDADGFGYINKTGAFAFPTRFFLAWSFSEGLARVQTKDGKMSYINPLGEIVFTVPGLTWADPFSEGLADAALQMRPGQRIYGYIDHTGNFVIKPQFQTATPFVNGLAQVALNGEMGYIDKSGAFVWKVKMPAIPR